MWQGRSARNAHSACSCPGRSTSTHSNRVSLTACFSPRAAARTAGATNTSSPRSGVVLGELEQRREPPLLAGAAARQEVIASPPRGDLQPAVAPAAGGELDQPGGLLVQHSELQRPVSLGRQLAGEDAPVSEPDPAAQPVALAACAVR